MINILHKKYEFDFPYGQEGFELLYEFIIQPNSNYNIWFPRYSNKIWHGVISNDRKKFEVNSRRQNSKDCEIILDSTRNIIIVETSIISWSFLPALFFLIALLSIVVYENQFDWGILIPLIFIAASCFLPFLARYEKIKSIKYNIRMVEDYLRVNKK